LGTATLNSDSFVQNNSLSTFAYVQAGVDMSGYSTQQKQALIRLLIKEMEDEFHDAAEAAFFANYEKGIKLIEQVIVQVQKNADLDKDMAKKLEEGSLAPLLKNWKCFIYQETGRYILAKLIKKDFTV
jgi:hypothetical protein